MPSSTTVVDEKQLNELTMQAYSSIIILLVFCFYTQPHVNVLTLIFTRNILMSHIFFAIIFFNMLKSYCLISNFYSDRKKTDNISTITRYWQ